MRRALVATIVLAGLGGAAAVWRGAAVAPRAHQRPVVLVGLDGADWQLLDDYLGQGAMPQLARLVAEGRRGVLVTQQPPLSPLVWTTMVTGRGPLEHRILDFTRRHPGNGAREPITSDERRVPALWNMADRRGLSSAVLGLWATYPAEAVRGVIVSDRLFSFQAGGWTGPGIVAPAGREGWARAALDVAEQETGYDTMHALLPWLEAGEYERLLHAPAAWAHPVTALRRILVETRVYERLALEELRAGPPDLTIVYVQGTDAIGHVFAPYAPPRLPAVSEADFTRYSAVPEAYFRRVDALLGEVRRAAEATGATVMVASDHGFKWKEGRPTLSSVATATAGQWHRDEGVYVLWGPGVSPGASGRGGVAQVCATVLALLGLPPARGIAGPPLPGVAPSTAAPWDYDAAFSPPPAAGAAPAAEQIEKLRALGYIGAAAPGPAAGVASTRSAGSFNNEGLILAEQGRTAEARAAFERALSADPSLASARWNLSDRLFADGERDRADALLLAAFDGSPEALLRLRARAQARTRSGEGPAARDLLRRASAAHPGDAALRLLLGRLLLDAGDCRAATAEFEAAVGLGPRDPVALASAGLGRLCLGDAAGAREAFRRSLALDPDQPELRRYLEADR